MRANKTTALTHRWPYVDQAVEKFRLEVETSFVSFMYISRKNQVERYTACLKADYNTVLM